MKTLAPSIVTHRDSKGRKFMDIVAAAYDKARLSDGPDGEAQRINDTPGLAEHISQFISEHRTPNLFADEEVVSKCVYPPEYKGPKPITEQIKALADIFGLDGSPALEYARHLPDFKSFVPEDALPWVGWFAVISDSALVKLFPQIESIAGYSEYAVRYCLGIERVLEKIAATRPFKNWRAGQIVPQQLRLSERTALAHQKIAAVQNGDIWLIAAQLGMRYPGCSTRRARALFVKNEFGLGSISGATIALVHPDRFVRSEELDVDLPGDEFDIPGADVRFGSAPLLGWIDGRLGFGACRCGFASEYYGSASAFLPQENLVD